MDQSKSPGLGLIIVVAAISGIVITLAVTAIARALEYNINPGITGGITGGLVGGVIIPMMRRKNTDA